MENDYSFRPATIKDVNFIARSIIEGEKGGTGILSYNRIFEISETETLDLLKEVLKKGVSGCDLSLSSFWVALNKDQLIATTCLWREGMDGTPASWIKGNLLYDALGIELIKRSIRYKEVVQDINFEPPFGWIQIGSVYVSQKWRGKGILGSLLTRHIKDLKNDDNVDSEICVSIFSHNKSSLMAFKKNGFSEYKVLESDRPEASLIFPSNKKIVLIKNINKWHIP